MEIVYAKKIVVLWVRKTSLRKTKRTLIVLRAFFRALGKTQIPILRTPKLRAAKTMAVEKIG